MLSIFALLSDISPEDFILQNWNYLYIHLATIPYLMHLFNHFSVALTHGVLQKFHPFSAVAMDHREGVFAQIWPHVLKGQVEAVATETTKLRNHQ